MSGTHLGRATNFSPSLIIFEVEVDFATESILQLIICSYLIDSSHLISKGGFAELFTHLETKTQSTPVCA
jgi:hypothetical protein